MAKKTSTSKPTQRCPLYYPVVDVLCCVKEVLELNNDEYVSKEVAFNHPAKESTVSQVLKRVDKYVENCEKGTRSPVKVRQANAVIKWITNLEGGGLDSQNEFLATVKQKITRASDPYGTPSGPIGLSNKDIPFVCCIFKLKETHDNKLEESQKRKNSEFLGELRKRGEFFVKLLQIKRPGQPHMDTHGSPYYGPDTNSILGEAPVYQIVDRKGNYGYFFSKLDLNITAGDCFLMRATPASHYVSKFYGNKETRFNRVQLLQNVGPKVQTVVWRNGEFIEVTEGSTRSDVK